MITLIVPPLRAIFKQHCSDSQLFYMVANIPTTAAVMIAAVAHPK